MLTIYTMSVDDCGRLLVAVNAPNAQIIEPGELDEYHRRWNGTASTCSTFGAFFDHVSKSFVKHLNATAPFEGKPPSHFT